MALFSSKLCAEAVALPYTAKHAKVLESAWESISDFIQEEISCSAMPPNTEILKIQRVEHRKLWQKYKLHRVQVQDDFTRCGCEPGQIETHPHQEAATGEHPVLLGVCWPPSSNLASRP